MLKINKHIELVRSNTAGLSSMSQESCNAILAVLSRHYDNVQVTVVNNLSDLKLLVSKKPDLVFLGMKFIPVHPYLGSSDSDKIWLSDYLDANSIAYTGSNQLAHELERSKPLAKQRVQASGLKTSSFIIIKQNQEMVEDSISLPYPLFVKPTNKGGGIGIDSDSVVQNFTQLEKKVRHITNDLKADALIEQYLPGREFSVALLKEVNNPELSVMPIELIAPLDKSGTRLLSSKIKSSNSEKALGLKNNNIRSKVNELALGVFYALGARDYGRVDIRLDEFGEPYFLEANLLPSLISGYGSFPKACVLNIGLGYEQMIMRIVNLGLERSINNFEVFDELDINPSIETNTVIANLA